MKIKRFTKALYLRFVRLQAIEMINDQKVEKVRTQNNSKKVFFKSSGTIFIKYSSSLMSFDKKRPWTSTTIVGNANNKKRDIKLSLLTLILFISNLLH